MRDIAYPSGPVILYPRPSADHPGPVPRFRGEWVPIVEPSGLVYGKAPREWCHSGVKALHPVVHLNIIDRESNIYLQKRAITKDLFPGLWDTAVGGHISYGEQAQDALYREAEEELGLTAMNPVLLDTYIWEGETEKELVFAYAIVGHPKLTPNMAEISCGQWWTVRELEKSLRKGRFTPNFEYEYARLKSALLAML